MNPNWKQNKQTQGKKAHKTNKQKSLQKTNARRKSYQEYHNQIAKEIKGKSYKQPEKKEKTTCKSIKYMYYSRLLIGVQEF